MTQLLHLEPVDTVVRRRAGVVFVPCVICRAPVDLAVVTEANDAPICGRHFVADYPPQD